MGHCQEGGLLWLAASRCCHPCKIATKVSLCISLGGRITCHLPRWCGQDTLLLLETHRRTRHDTTRPASFLPLRLLRLHLRTNREIGSLPCLFLLPTNIKHCAPPTFCLSPFSFYTLFKTFSSSRITTHPCPNHRPSSSSSLFSLHHTTTLQGISSQV
jgi:hypothetical protein